MTEASGPGAAAELAAEVDKLERELAEIELLIGQARTEAGRHEQKRAAIAERQAAASARPGDPAELAELNAQLLAATRRAALMEAQIDVLEGKQKTLVRYRDSLAGIVGRVDAGELALAPAAAAEPGGPRLEGGPSGAGPAAAGASPQSVARLVLGAQEDLRRDIARAMHDGPAQSLTNIVLQAQIVDRLLGLDPAAARAEVHELTAMVQRTLEATKAFIFDMRPMVLDDLGLVPTLRRLARDRGRQAGLPIELESLGADRRLPIEVESAVFRVVDEAVLAWAATRPQAIAVALDWGEEELEARVTARVPAPEPDGAVEPAPRPDLPPALAAFLEDRRAARPVAATPEALTADLRREMTERAASVGGRLTVSDDGHELRLVVPAAVTAGR
jgi:two-component system, NarL family, sensor histidine kinase DegS